MGDLNTDDIISEFGTAVRALHSAERKMLVLAKPRSAEDQKLQARAHRLRVMLENLSAVIACEWNDRTDA